MYITASLIIAGALEEDIRFDTDEEFQKWLDDVEGDLSDPEDEKSEVYRIVHDHPEGDCVCVQFLTDHHPYWTNY